MLLIGVVVAKSDIGIGTIGLLADEQRFILLFLPN